MQRRQSFWPSRPPCSSISASPCSSRNGSDVSDAALIAILLAAFALAVGLVQVLGRLIDSGGRDGWDGEPRPCRRGPIQTDARLVPRRPAYLGEEEDRRD